MGRTIRYRYSYEETPRRGYHTGAAWPTTRAQDRYRPAALLGPPNAEKLAAHVDAYHASLATHNAHLPPGSELVYARIVDTHAEPGDPRRIVAEWCRLPEETGR